MAYVLFQVTHSLQIINEFKLTMKKIATLFFLVLYWNSSSAQSDSTDQISNDRFRVSLGYNVPRLLGVFTGNDRFGPIHLDGHYFLYKPFSIGLNIDYAQAPFETRREYFYPDTNVKRDYAGQSNTFQYLIEGTYYLRFPNAEAKLLRRWNIYATIGLGVGIVKSNYTLQNPTEGTPHEESDTEYYFARQITLGAEYQFHNKLGLFFETGVTLSRLQFGASYKF